MQRARAEEAPGWIPAPRIQREEEKLEEKTAAGAARSLTMGPRALAHNDAPLRNTWPGHLRCIINEISVIYHYNRWATASRVYTFCVCGVCVCVLCHIHTTTSNAI